MCQFQSKGKKIWCKKQKRTSAELKKQTFTMFCSIHVVSSVFGSVARHLCMYTFYVYPHAFQLHPTSVSYKLPFQKHVTYLSHRVHIELIYNSQQRPHVIDASCTFHKCSQKCQRFFPQCLGMF